MRATQLCDMVIMGMKEEETGDIKRRKVGRSGLDFFYRLFPKETAESVSEQGPGLA